MAEVARPTIRPTLGSHQLGHNCRISGLIAGEDLQACEAVYVKSDGKVWRANGTAANAAARVRGFAAMNALAAQTDAITIMHSCEVAWANTLTPGADLYLSAAVPGGLSTTATTGGAAAIAYVKDANHIVLLPPN
jgi:hypothetical protein